MKFKLMMTAAIAATTAAAALPASADAHRYHDSRYDRDHDSRYYHGRSYYRHKCGSGNGAVGTVAGGVGGALIGNAVGGGALGTIGGGIGGALLGRTLDKANTRSRNRC